ncbi:hypothetical protein [Xenorhabdus thailandensis]|uniref:hypothetical protein n=1 Tax=Xenorhabdus thailandensis TaxID=3136255 RepID=UPI0030F49C45
MDFTNEKLSRASVIWNINRQMSFSIGTALFTMIFNLLQQGSISTNAYHLTFILAAIIGLLPLTILHNLKKYSEKICENKKS